MSRTVKEIKIEEGGRDRGKLFILTEMDAVIGERWADMALLKILEAGIPVPEDAQGMAGLASVPGIADTPGTNSAVATLAALRIKRALQDPVLDGWWECVRFQPENRKIAPQRIIEGEGCQIEERNTIGQLRRAVLDMHLGFFSPESPSTTALPSPVRRRKGSFATPM